MKYLITLIVTLGCFAIHAQDLTGSELLEKAIKFHDPQGNWKSLNSNFTITMTTPNRPERVSKISVNQAQQKFHLEATVEQTTTAYALDKKECTLSLNGKKDFSEEEAKKHRLTCERANMMRNYYMYLYGLPMKLKDKGTIIDEKVVSKTFKGKSYWVLKATYEKEVGNDIWYFYFDKETYAMEVYQFFHDESKNYGEYILLTGMETIQDIKMPKTRAWYYNKDDKYLGTDVLSK